MVLQRFNAVGVGALDDPFVGAESKPKIRLKKTGKIAEKHLLSSENIPGVKIDKYVIMPDHIHAIIFLNYDKCAPQERGSSRAPTPTTAANATLPHIVSTFKRFCSKEIGNNIFQRGYYEHIIRDKADYDSILEYTYNNPTAWYYGELP